MPPRAHADSFLGKKKMRKLPHRRAVDYTSSVMRYMKVKYSYFLNTFVLLLLLSFRHHFSKKPSFNLTGTCNLGVRLFVHFSMLYEPIDFKVVMLYGLISS